MATYYVRPDGSNANTGTGQSTSQAWQTITYALTTMVLTTGVNYLYIAPGTYRETPTVVVTPTTTNTLVIQGDPTASIFTSMAAGVVRLTNFNNDAIVPTKGITFTCNKSFVTIKNIYFSGNGYAYFQDNNPLVLQDNVFTSIANVAGDGACKINAVSSSFPVSRTIQRCVFTGDVGLYLQGSPYYDIQNLNTTIESCYFSARIGLWIDGGGTFTAASGITINGCTFVCSANGIANSISSPSASNPNIVKNSSFYGLTSTTVGIQMAVCTQTYNYFVVAVPLSGPASSATSTVGVSGYDLGYGKMAMQAPVAMFTGHYGSLMSTSAQFSTLPALDNLSYPYASAVNGAYSQTSPAGTSFYFPTERNASSITITPGSTSQSIELYLGATGLTASTSGLNARYNRTRTASVNIPLVPVTITQPWVAGGFAEVDAIGMPGLYRLDLPNEAIVFGADDVTVAVRGASASNGAYITVELKQLGNIISTTGYKLISDQLGANGALDVIKGSSITVKLQITDVNQKPVPIGSATCTVQVYSLNNLVATYPVVIQYQSNGEMTFVLDTAVTTAPGSYNIYVNRNNGGSDTVVYGPMKLTVSNL
jgi:hypothetical protein